MEALGGIFNHSPSVDGAWNDTLIDEANSYSSSSSSNATIRLSTLTIRQEKAISLVGVAPGFLSILGSLAILYKVLHNWARAGPYDRLLLGLSVCDIAATIAYVWSPFWIPSDPEDSDSVRIYAIGTPGTCNWLLGWTTQFAFSAICYNGALSFYYLLTVRYSVKRQEFTKTYEPWFHGSILAFFLGTATFGSAIGLFNELDFGLGCWVSNYPDGCADGVEDECTSWYYGIFMGALPTILTIAALVVNNMRIFFFVREKLQISKQGSASRHPRKGYPSSSSEKDDQSSTSRDQNTKDTNLWGSGRSNASTDSTSSLSREEWERTIRQAAQINEVATQGFLYVFFFFVTYTPAFLVRVLEAMEYTQEDEADMYILLLISNLLLPLQGFFNMLVYTRPNYVRVRAAFPGRPKLWAMKFACFSSEIPKMSEISVEAVSRQAIRKRSRRNLLEGVPKYSSDLPPVPEGENEDASEPICLLRPENREIGPPSSWSQSIDDPETEVSFTLGPRLYGSTQNQAWQSHDTEDLSTSYDG